MAIFQGSLPLTNTTEGSYYITEVNQEKQLKLWLGSCEEYEALETIEDDIIYITTDGDPESKIDNDYMLKSIYDKNNLQIDIYEYIDTQLEIYGKTMYDVVIINDNGTPTLQSGSYELVEAKIENNQPVLASVTEITSISGYSLARTVSTSNTIKNIICQGVIITTDDYGNRCIRLNADYSYFDWYSDNSIVRYWPGGENG